MLKHVIVVALLAGTVGGWYAALPPYAQAPLTISGTPAPRVRGAIHVHSRRSDGTGDVESIAGAAARAGLDFVILTDHGDATREPDPPQYREGVLCIDGVELSTEEGHVVALGLPSAPYPLGGEARDVIEDILRLGGFAIAAHPGSENPGLQWSDWDAPLGGLEWLNADSEWRDEPLWSLARALLTYPIRSTETLVSLLDRPTATMERWDDLTQRRRVVAVAGSDAHARVDFRSNFGEPYASGSLLHVPSYERMFHLFSNTLPNTTFGGDAVTDAQAVLDAIRAGHVYSAVDGLGSPAVMSFSATSGTSSAVAGDILPLDGPVTLTAKVQAPDAARIELVKDGALLQTAVGTILEEEVDAVAAVYRVEITLPGSPGEPPVPWVVSNPIYVGRDVGDTTPSDTRPRASQFAVQYEGGPAAEWGVETSQASLGALDEVPAVEGTQLSLRYALGGTVASSPFAAFVMPAGSALAEYDRLIFTAWASRPMRVSVQFREEASEAGERWHRSVYLDLTPREVTVYFDDIMPRGVTSRPQPILSEIQSILFVVDTVNTPIGGRGTLWMDEVKYAR